MSLAVDVQAQAQLDCVTYYYDALSDKDVKRVRALETTIKITPYRMSVEVKRPQLR